MPKLGLPRWLGGGGTVRRTPDADLQRRDAEVREAFGLTRWFSGIGAATAAQHEREASPETDRRIRGAIDTLPVTLFEFDASGIYTCAAGRYVGLFGSASEPIRARLAPS